MVLSISTLTIHGINAAIEIRSITMYNGPNSITT